MTDRKKAMFLIGFCLVGLIVSIPGFMIRSYDSNVKSVQSALLNRRYKDSVNYVTVGGAGGGYTFMKTTDAAGNSFWLGSDQEGQAFPADSTVLTQLIERAATVRSMAEVSDSYSSWAAYGLTDAEAVCITFGTENADGSKETYSTLYFGYENADGSLLYVRNDRKSSVWRIQNDLSSYLSSSLSLWADETFFPNMDEASSGTEITSISVSDDSGQRFLYNDVQNSAQFDSLIHTLYSMRGSTVILKDELDSITSAAETLCSVNIATDKGTQYGFTVYGLTMTEEADEDGTAYFVRNYGVLQSGPATYMLQISSWTYNKILEKLTF